jgi:hypothetical protein
MPWRTRTSGRNSKPSLERVVKIVLLSRMRQDSVNKIIMMIMMFTNIAM